MNDKKIIRVSVSEASRLFGVSTKTIREAVKKQSLQYIVVSNRYKINFESLVEWVHGSPKRFQQFKSAGIGQYVDNWQISTSNQVSDTRVQSSSEQSAPEH